MDADVVRKFFMTDKAQSHIEMSGYFELVFQYRELTNAKGAGQLQLNSVLNRKWRSREQLRRQQQ